MDVEVVSRFKRPLARDTGQVDPEVAALNVFIHIGRLVARVPTVCALPNFSS